MIQHSAPTGRLVVLTNAPSPYRITFFNGLRRTLGRYHCDFHVLYCTAREPHRHWEVRLDDQEFDWEILPGKRVRIGSLGFHVNASVFRKLRELRPSWLLNAGSWATPTMLMTTQRRGNSDYPRLFWSEGHRDAVMHPTGTVARVRRYCLSRYDGFAVPNAASADFVRQETDPAKPVLSLPNTVDDQFFRQARDLDRKALRRRLQVPPGDTVLTTVAQLEERKGVIEFVKSFRFLSDTVQPNTSLVVLGDGPLLAKIQHLVSETGGTGVRVLGHQDQTSVREWLAVSDAFVLATRRDPNPLSVIESAFAGLPLILSKAAGNCPELVEDGNNGFVLHELDPASIARVLNRFVATSPEVRRRMGDRSFELAVSGFELGQVCESFVNELMRTFPLRRSDRRLKRYTAPHDRVCD